MKHFYKILIAGVAALTSPIASGVSNSGLAYRETRVVCMTAHGAKVIGMATALQTATKPLSFVLGSELTSFRRSCTGGKLATFNRIGGTVRRRHLYSLSGSHFTAATGLTAISSEEERDEKLHEWELALERQGWVDWADGWIRWIGTGSVFAYTVFAGVSSTLAGWATWTYVLDEDTKDRVIDALPTPVRDRMKVRLKLAEKDPKEPANSDNDGHPDDDPHSGKVRVKAFDVGFGEVPAQIPPKLAERLSRSNRDNGDQDQNGNGGAGCQPGDGDSGAATVSARMEKAAALLERHFERLDKKAKRVNAANAKREVTMARIWERNERHAQWKEKRDAELEARKQRNADRQEAARQRRQARHDDLAREHASRMEAAEANRESDLKAKEVRRTKAEEKRQEVLRRGRFQASRRWLEQELTRQAKEDKEVNLALAKKQYVAQLKRWMGQLYWLRFFQKAAQQRQESLRQQRQQRQLMILYKASLQAKADASLKGRAWNLLTWLGSKAGSKLADIAKTCAAAHRRDDSWDERPVFGGDTLDFGIEPPTEQQLNDTCDALGRGCKSVASAAIYSAETVGDFLNEMGKELERQEEVRQHASKMGLNPQSQGQVLLPSKPTVDNPLMALFQQTMRDGEMLSSRVRQYS